MKLDFLASIVFLLTSDFDKVEFLISDFDNIGFLVSLHFDKVEFLIKIGFLVSLHFDKVEFRTSDFDKIEFLVSPPPPSSDYRLHETIDSICKSCPIL